MNKNLPQDPTNDRSIEDMLGSFAPEPSERFQNKMSAVPWQKSDSLRGSNISGRHRPSRKLVLALAALGILLAIFVITFVPSFRAAANQIFHLFLPASSDQLNVQIPLTSPGDLLDFSNPNNFIMRIDEAAQEAGYDVKQIPSLPSGLKLIGSRYDASYKTVTILYVAGDYKLFLSQRLLNKGEDVFSIGAGAVVNNVKVGNIDAEFVVGGWKALSTQSPIGLQAPTDTANLHAIWDNDFPQFTLRWQANGYIYELRSDGEGSPSQSVLINLANELK